MKLKAVSVIVLILFLASILSIWMSPIAAQPTGMVSYWRLNEGSGTTAYDSVGSNHGTLINGPTWATGKVDGALSFDGVDDYVEMSGITMGSAFSVEAWAYLNTSDSQPNAEIVSQSNDLERVFDLRRDDTNAWRFDLYTGGANNPLISSTNFNTGWHFIVGTWNGSHMKLYVDSSEIASAPLSSADSIPSVPIRIGTGINLAQQIRYWKHEIDEVAIYNRALTPEEIEQHYQNGLSGEGYWEPPPPPPVGGKATPINLPISKVELLNPYIGLTMLLAVAVIALGYVKKRKRRTETIS